MAESMFENMALEHGKRVSAPRKVEVPEEVTKLIEQAWAYQNDPETPEEFRENPGHIVRFTNETEVEAFHKVARAASAQRETPLKYRRLSRVGPDKNEKTAYFSLELKAENNGATESEGDSTSETAASKPASPRARRGSRK